MVTANIKMSEHTNRILNIVKAKYGLKDKSEALEIITNEFEENILEPGLKPEFIETMKNVEKQRVIKIGTAEQLRKRYD